MRRLGRFAGLPPAQRRLLLLAALLLPLTYVALRIVPFASLLSVAQRLVRPLRNAALPPDRVVWAVLAAGRRVPGGRHCLTHALVTHILLRRYGYDSQLRIGLMPIPGHTFRAHAWVERDGLVLTGGAPRSAFTPLRANF